MAVKLRRNSEDRLATQMATRLLRDPLQMSMTPSQPTDEMLKHATSELRQVFGDEEARLRHVVGVT